MQSLFRNLQFSDAVDWKREWKEGHYVLVVGYDENKFTSWTAVTGHYAFDPNGEF